MENALSAIGMALWPEDILLDIKVSDKTQLFAEIGRHMEAEHGMPLRWVVAGLTRREQLGSTALGEGVAIPHCRVEGLKRIQAAYLRLHSPIPFEAPDGLPVTDVLVVMVPAQATEEHLQFLAAATQVFSDCELRERLHLCRHPAGVISLLEERT